MWSAEEIARLLRAVERLASEVALLRSTLEGEAE